MSRDPMPTPTTVLRDPAHLLAFGFGAGLLPIAPGTWASLFTAIGYYFLPPLALPYYLAGVAALGLIGIWVSGISARRLGVHDHGGIVIDEVVGMLLTLSLVGPQPAWILVAFLCFRIADIWKPWPIRDVDHRLSGGLGIMLDDVVAADLRSACFCLRSPVASFTVILITPKSLGRA